MALPELCTKCRELKDASLMTSVRVRGRMHDRVRICHACLSVKKVTKDRAHRESPLEKRARETLLDLGYHFRQEHQVGKFFYDFALPALRILVEVDGYRWHAHRAHRDRAKTRLAENAGWGLDYLVKLTINLLSQS